MSENANAERAAATEAAQHVVDEVTSWNHSAERDAIDAKLDEGLDAAGVEPDTGEKGRIVEEIDELKQDESAGKPQVGSADAAEGAVPHSVALGTARRTERRACRRRVSAWARAEP